MAVANLDIEAVVRDRLAKIGLSDKVKPALIDGGATQPWARLPLPCQLHLRP